jgi:DeoR/GlpR family transcriptional regulator of sugar metabolism
MQADRRGEIAEFVRKEGKITIDEICARYDVSEMTARRDLQILAREGVVRRVHGGAISAFGRSYEPPYRFRSKSNFEVKRLIGQKAAELIADGESIALDVGTTTIEIARALKDRHNLTVVTSSLPIAYEIVRNHSIGTDLRLIISGGVVRPGEHSMVGHIAENTYAEIHVDKAFVGVGGISLQDGFTEYNMEDTQVKRALVKTARQIIVVADSSKFGRTTFNQVCPLKVVNMIVTDRDAPQAIVDALCQAGIQVVIAG